VRRENRKAKSIEHGERKRKHERQKRPQKDSGKEYLEDKVKGLLTIEFSTGD
jgi:hypothetical protein